MRDASVPEAAVDKDGDTGSGKCNVRCSRETLDLNSEPQTASVQLAAEINLRPSRGSWHPSHLRCDPDAERGWAHAGHMA